MDRRPMCLPHPRIRQLLQKERTMVDEMASSSDLFFGMAGNRMLRSLEAIVEKNINRQTDEIVSHLYGLVSASSSSAFNPMGGMETEDPTTVAAASAVPPPPPHGQNDVGSNQSTAHFSDTMMEGTLSLIMSRFRKVMSMTDKKSSVAIADLRKVRDDLSSLLEAEDKAACDLFLASLPKKKKKKKRKPKTAGADASTGGGELSGGGPPPPQMARMGVASPSQQPPAIIPPTPISNYYQQENYPQGQELDEVDDGVTHFPPHPQSVME